MKCIMKWLMLCGLLWVNSVFASENEHHNTSIITVPIETIQTQVVVTDDSIKSAIATSNAMSGQQFNYGVHKWQGSFAVGGYDGKSAIAGGIAKRYNGVLYTGSVGKRSYNLTANWTF